MYQEEITKANISQRIVTPAEDHSEEIIKSWSAELQRQHPNSRWITLKGSRVLVNGSGDIIASHEDLKKKLSSKKESSSTELKIEGDKASYKGHEFTVTKVKDKVRFGPIDTLYSMSAEEQKSYRTAHRELMMREDSNDRDYLIRTEERRQHNEKRQRERELADRQMQFEKKNEWAQPLSRINFSNNTYMDVLERSRRKQAIQEALDKGKFDQAVHEGNMSEEHVTEVLASAGIRRYPKVPLQDVESTATALEHKARTALQTVRVHRGVGNNVDAGDNEGFSWVALDESVARQYAGLNEKGEFNVRSWNMQKPEQTFNFNYNSSVAVRGSEIGDILTGEVGRQFEAGTISETQMNRLLYAIGDYEKAAGQELEEYHTKLNKKDASEKVSRILAGLGYDSIRVDEMNSAGQLTPTYGMISKKAVAQAYHEAKSDKGHPELIARVEGLLRKSVTEENDISKAFSTLGW